MEMIQDRLTATFSALADPTRRAILARLAVGEASVNELVEPFNISRAQWRPCTLEAVALKDVADWLEPYRRLWEVRLDRLEAHLRQLQAEQIKEEKPDD